MIEAVKVRLREGGKIQDYDTNGLELGIGSRVVVPTPEGLSLGTVVSNPSRLDEEYVKTSFRKIARLATAEDEERVRRHADLERSAFAFCQRQIKEMRLPMKLVEVEYLFEGGKAVFYFTAEGRVDFRQLVRELARECRTRVEMRQIGVRDEARMIGGYGICGRELCCASFLSEFEPISIRMAKDQDLPLSPGKVSGVCGRLMCCLGYESRVYEEFKQGLPRIGERIRLVEGIGRVRKYNLFEESFTVEMEGGELLRVAKADWHRGRREGAPREGEPVSGTPVGAPPSGAPAGDESRREGGPPRREGEQGRRQGGERRRGGGRGRGRRGDEGRGGGQGGPQAGPGGQGGRGGQGGGRPDRPHGPGRGGSGGGRPGPASGPASP